MRPNVVCDADNNAPCTRIEVEGACASIAGHVFYLMLLEELDVRPRIARAIAPPDPRLARVRARPTAPP